MVVCNVSMEKGMICIHKMETSHLAMIHKKLKNKTFWLTIKKENAKINVSNVPGMHKRKIQEEEL